MENTPGRELSRYCSKVYKPTWPTFPARGSSSELIAVHLKPKVGSDNLLISGALMTYTIALRPSSLKEFRDMLQNSWKVSGDSWEKTVS